MSFLSKFSGIAAAVLKYGALALPAIAVAQQEIGSAAGDPVVQQSKKQMAVAMILAGAHAGESVPVAQVQQISGLVDFLVSTAKATGLLGKSADPKGSISVPQSSETTPILDQK